MQGYAICFMAPGHPLLLQEEPRLQPCRQEEALRLEPDPPTTHKRSTRMKCLPFTSSVGSGWGRIDTMYEKGLAPSSCRFFIGRRSSWLRSLSMILSSRLMQSSLTFSIQLTSQPRMCLPTNHQENISMSIEKTA